MVQKTNNTKQGELRMIVKIENHTNSGRRSGWTKLVTGCDLSKSNGFAFEGRFLNDGEQELQPGDILVQKNPEGSVKNPWSSGVCLRVSDTGELIRVQESTFVWEREFLSFRNLVAAELQKQNLRRRNCRGV